MLSPKKPNTKISKPRRRAGESEASFRSRMRAYTNATSRSNTPQGRARSYRELNALTRGVERSSTGTSKSNKSSMGAMKKINTKKTITNKSRKRY